MKLYYTFTHITLYRFSCISFFNSRSRIVDHQWWYGRGVRLILFYFMVLRRHVVYFFLHYFTLAYGRRLIIQTAYCSRLIIKRPTARPRRRRYDDEYDDRPFRVGVRTCILYLNPPLLRTHCVSVCAYPL